MGHLEILFAAIALLLMCRNAQGFPGARVLHSLKTSYNCRVMAPMCLLKGGKPSYSISKASTRHRFELDGGGSLDGDLNNKNSTGIDFKKIIPIVGLVAVVGAAAGHVGGLDISAIIDSSVSKISAMGPYGYIYFAFVSL